MDITTVLVIYVIGGFLGMYFCIFLDWWEKGFSTLEELILGFIFSWFTLMVVIPLAFVMFIERLKLPKLPSLDTKVFDFFIWAFMF